MKKILLFIALISIVISTHAQITITSSDMPVSGDTLRYSIASTVGSPVNLGDSGANFTWNYTSLTPLSQGVDTYKTATAVNLLYALTIPITAYGYKIADTLPAPGGVLPVSITQLYTFFQKISSPSSYAAVAFGALISGIPTPANYSTNDTWYFFPLNYLNNDSSNYALNVSLATLGSLQRVGFRKSRVDGWGNISTPYTTSPVSCLRIRSQINEIDSISIAGTGTFGIPNNTVEYKWLANGEHYPLLWVTTNSAGGTETITSIRYRDIARVGPDAVPAIPSVETGIKAYPVPTLDGIVHLDLPVSWMNFQVDVFDISSKLVLSENNNNRLDIKNLPAGHYVARVTSEGRMGYVHLSK